MPTANPQIIKIVEQGRLQVPDRPLIPFIEGDGIGRDIWPAAQLVIDKSVYAAYGPKRQIQWLELMVGEKGYHQTGQWLSDEALETIRSHVVA